MGTLCDDLCTFMKISHPVLLRMKNVSDKSCGENLSIHLMFNNCFLKIALFIRSCGEKYGAARQATADNIIWCMCVVCWITKATDTHSKY
jgi:hypothetical protein